jgi:hypothetical protein
MKTKQFIFFTFFLLSGLCVSAQKITVQSLAQRKSIIEHQIRTDLSTELENIEDLSVI